MNFHYIIFKDGIIFIKEYIDNQMYVLFLFVIMKTVCNYIYILTCW